jgi:tetratricopeptide (TPR) repeat protein
VRHALIVATLLAPAIASASPSDEFQEARVYFRANDCKDARLRLTDLLFPTERLSGRDQLVEAYAMLGACQIEEHQQDDAKEEFEKALQIDPDKELDANFFTNEAIRVFDEVKATLDAKRKQEAEDQARFMAADALRQQLANLHVYERHPSWPQLVPFGVGQFNNGEYAKGGVFAAAGLATFGTSLGIFSYLVFTYGFHSTTVPLSQAQTVLNLQRVQVGTGIAFLALWGLGIYDAHKHYRSEVRVPNSEKLLRDLETPTTPLPPPPPPKPVSTTLHWGPIVVPNGGGIGLSLETP